MGMEIFSLADLSGHTDKHFDYFAEKFIAQGAALASVRAYLYGAANFLDYAVEEGSFSGTATIAEINRMIDRYIPMRRALGDLRKKRRDGHVFLDDSWEHWALDVGDRLKFRPLNQTITTVAAINRFLNSCRDFTIAEVDRLNLSVDFTRANYRSVSLVIERSRGITRHEKMAMLRRSALSNLMRSGPRRITSRVSSPGKGDPPPKIERDFPLERLPSLINAANTYRDKVRIIALAGLGIRQSEADNLRWRDIDFSTRQVFVHDPEFAVGAFPGVKTSKGRFKGREHRETRFLPVLKDLFFQNLRMYIANEYIPDCGHDFVLQCLQGPDAGKPYEEVSDEGKRSLFRRLVNKIDCPTLPDGSLPTGHSLRHLYGVYMLNFLPVPGGFGLTLEQVKKLMGHKDITQTQRYARSDTVILAAQMEYADRYIMQRSGGNLDAMELMATRLEAQAAALRKANA